MPSGSPLLTVPPRSLNHVIPFVINPMLLMQMAPQATRRSLHGARQCACSHSWTKRAGRGQRGRARARGRTPGLPATLPAHPQAAGGRRHGLPLASCPRLAAQA